MPQKTTFFCLILHFKLLTLFLCMIFGSCAKHLIKTHLSSPNYTVELKSKFGCHTCTLCHFTYDTSLLFHHCHSSLSNYFYFRKLCMTSGSLWTVLSGHQHREHTSNIPTEFPKLIEELLKMLLQ